MTVWELREMITELLKQDLPDQTKNAYRNALVSIEDCIEVLEDKNENLSH